MGGRGSLSYNGHKIRVTATGKKVSGVMVAPDNRADIRNKAQSIGFRDVYNTSSIDSEVMNASLDKLKALEDKYGAIGNSTNIVLNGVNSDAFAYVARGGIHGSNVKSQTLNFSLENMGNANDLAGATKKAIANGLFSQAKTDRKTLLSYTATHEYGHILENVIYSNSKSSSKKTIASFADSAKKGIENIATKKYGYNKNKPVTSKYSNTNSREFFAEAFANANSGKPNAIGKALNDWVKQQGYGV